MKRGLQLLWLILAVALLGLAGSRHRSLNALKQQYRLVRTDPLENAPPMVAFTTVVLGGFRGILADLLWLRLNVLQEQGKYFELVQLADWITKLEPRFPQVWAFHAWNLAYNVSVLFDHPQDRWRWVRSGIELLRDQGIPYNVGEAQLYRELGWLFQHKIGYEYDQAHQFYKQAWAREMTELLGDGHPNFARLLSAQPGDPMFEQAQRMMRTYKLQPAVMRDVDQAYGPLDWRLPYAHAIYWAWRGRPYAEGFERVALTRMILQSLAAAFRQGRLVTDREGRFFMQAPDLALWPITLAAFQRARAEFPDVESFRDAYPHLLAQGVLTFCTFGRMEEARRIFEELARNYALEETRDGFDAFVFRNFIERMGPANAEDVLQAVEGAAFQAARWQWMGDHELANGYRGLATFLWRYYEQHRAAVAGREQPSLPPLDEILEKGAREAQQAFESGAEMSAR